MNLDNKIYRYAMWAILVFFIAAFAVFASDGFHWVYETIFNPGFQNNL